MHNDFRRCRKIFFLWLGFIFLLHHSASAQTASAQQLSDQVFSARGASTPWAENAEGRLRLIAKSPTVGKELKILLGLHFQTAPDWHIYWRSPGDAGYPPKIDWAGSENLAAAKILWPTPARFSIGKIETIGYTGEIVLPIEITLSAAQSKTQFRAHVDYLTCKEICVPHNYRFALDLYDGLSLSAPEADLIDIFYQSAADTGGQKSLMNIRQVLIAGQDAAPSIEIHGFKADGFSKPDVFLESNLPLAFSKPQITRGQSPGEKIFTVEVSANDPKDFKELTRAPITITMVDSGKSYETTVTPMRALPPKSWLAILALVGLGVLGGLILNAMPCVFPVLSIKLLQIIAKHDHEKTWVRKSFLAASAGIICSFWLLASILVGLKLTGQQIGWGIQFQQPAFLVFLIAVLLIFAGNLWGIFEIRLPRFIANLGRMGSVEDGHSLSKEFLMGAFATLLATPCSAPFLGTALGFALSAGIGEIYFIFTAIGIGLALPYLLIAGFPQLVYLLPKPGKWMVTLRRVMGVFLLLTALWLATIVVAQTTTVMDAPKQSVRFEWQAFDPMRIGGLVAGGKTVFVDVTADWCLTCKLNERLVIQSDKIQTLLARPDVVAMRADWTKPNAMIANYLASFGRYGIPFNAVYSKAHPTGLPLPELLSESVVEQAIQSTQK